MLSAQNSSWTVSMLAAPPKVAVRLVHRRPPARDGADTGQLVEHAADRCGVRAQQA
ncbi:hypothetical protein VA596_47165 [Amycolatopsis sp., V23-08]|uniref:Uncharacterized protein n=1 Tax=Amycolatopsis heterodermiae TaxID=3110235 RepID=A0ABU5RNT9_9PSEU|nr:hypothetical protein [Amycolatopsis sp., V23-08]MEA5367179.1 hypothetical protein [Amycolatopsis sp., V23-08]